MSRWRRRLSELTVLIAGAVTGACLAAGPRVAGASAGPAPDPWSSRELVPVRLAAVEGLAALQLTAGDHVQDVWRQGTGVDGFGLPQADYHVLDPPRGSAGWELDERLYPGSICVEPGPEGGLRATAWLDLEDYVAGVVAAEVVLWSAPAALLEAQAIAARSYAVASLDERARLGRAAMEDGVGDQAYRGTYRPDAAARSRGVDTRLAAAIARTRGQVLSVAGGVVDARFHAACGGSTADFEAVFGAPVAPAQGARPCPACSDDARAIIAAASYDDLPKELSDLAWTYTVDDAGLRGLARAFGIGPRVESIELPVDDGAGRWKTITLVGAEGRAEVSTVELRRALGWSTLKSGRITAVWPHPGLPITGGLAFRGLGSGHGVGLCQRGARALADDGWSATRILNHYYAGAAVRPLAGLRRAHR